MKKTKPLSKHEITERAFAIACDRFALAGMEINAGDGPATKQQFQLFLRGCAVGCERWAAYTAEREKTYKARMTSQRIGIILADGQRKTARR